jgi:rubrerythrin
MASGVPAFNVGQVLEIAGKLEHNGSRFYSKMKTVFVDDLRRDLCQALADWRTARERSLAQQRKQFDEQQTKLESTDLGDYLRAHPAATADLAVFADTLYRPHTPTGSDSFSAILNDAIARTQQAIGFYRGLKDFARDQQARTALDRIIGEERRYIRLLNQKSRANDRFQRIGITTYRQHDIP